VYIYKLSRHVKNVSHPLSLRWLNNGTFDVVKARRLTDKIHRQTPV